MWQNFTGRGSAPILCVMQNKSRYDPQHKLCSYEHNSKPNLMKLTSNESIHLAFYYFSVGWYKINSAHNRKSL